MIEVCVSVRRKTNDFLLSLLLELGLWEEMRSLVVARKEGSDKLTSSREAFLPKNKPREFLSAMRSGEVPGTGDREKTSILPAASVMLCRFLLWAEGIEENF